VNKPLLIIRLIVEAVLCLFCATGILLLAEIGRGTLILDVLGYLGMPRRYHPLEANRSADLHQLNLAITLGGFIAATIILLIGAFCFKDVVKIVRKLGLSHREL